MSKHRKEKANENTSHKKISFSRSLFVAVSFIYLVLIILIIYVCYSYINYVYLVIAGLQSWNATDEIVEQIENPTDSYIDNLNTIVEEYEIIIEIFNSDGNLVYSSSYAGEMTIPPYDDEDALPDSLIKNYTVIDSANTDYDFYFSIVLNDETQTEYLVFNRLLSDNTLVKVYKQKNAFDTSAKIAFTFLAIVCSIGYLIFIFICLFIIKKLTRPIEDISLVTRKLSRMDFSEKCKPSNILEVSILSESINTMSDNLQNALEDLKTKNEQLQKDIENERTIEQLRNILISGASHELKTPIAIIQGYSEGLKMFVETNPEKAKEYCDVIIKETNRMNDLTIKLLEVLKYESGEYNIVRTQFPVYTLLEEWFTRNQKILEDAKVTAINNIDHTFVANSDMFAISTVVNNYLSNALSHVSGEKIIMADAQDLGNVIRVSIFNTGEQIADKDIGKIWDSFYRADKSLSRKEGRFGLGLSIVAGIQKLCKHDYGVENLENGVRFWFDIDKAESDS